MFKNIDRSKSKLQGNIGIGQAIAYFTYMGYTISIPINDSQSYDLIVEIDDTLYKVQVKTASKKATSGYYIVELRSSSYYTNKNFESSSCDLLFVLLEDGNMFLIPSYDITTKTSITFNSSKEKYKVSVV